MMNPWHFYKTKLLVLIWVIHLILDGWVASPSPRRRRRRTEAVVAIGGDGEAQFSAYGTLFSTRFLSTAETMRKNPFCWSRDNSGQRWGMVTTGNFGWSLATSRQRVGASLTPRTGWEGAVLLGAAPPRWRLSTGGELDGCERFLMGVSASSCPIHRSIIQ
jgi:hypothetical protein